MDALAKVSFITSFFVCNEFGEVARILFSDVFGTHVRMICHGKQAKRDFTLRNHAALAESVKTYSRLPIQ